MPHQCTNCAREFDDGSKEMLSGCPDCGGNKFQFKPGGSSSADDAEADAAEPPEPPEPPGASSSVARTVGKTASTVRDLMSSSDSSEPSIGADGADPIEAQAPQTAPARENTAQASARTDVVTPDELPSTASTETEHSFQPVRSDDDVEGESDAQTADRDETGEKTGDVATAATGTRTVPASDQSPATGEAGDVDRPDLDELRAELNDQFESIKVCSPGQYELNLMELYDRDEYIIALQEDGRYSIQMPENFRE